VDRQEEAASTHISVLSVARWDEFAEALQPTFGLTPDKAFAEAVPATMRLEEKMVDALLARVKLAPPTSGTTATSTSTSENSTSTADDTTTATGSTSDSTTSTTTRAPGNVATATNQQFTPPQASTLGPAASVLTGDIALDPMTRYRAATALFQEVQILNRYIRDAAVRRQAIPYVVRLQISLLPVLRGQAYDAMTTFAFFSGPASPASPLLVAQQTFLESAIASRSFGAGVPTQAATTSPGTTCNTDHDAPVIVPLLVTDSLENALHSRSLAVVRDFGVALSLLTGGFGAGLDVQKQRNQIASLVGNDLNSLLTIGRVADNALRVRLGAMQQADARFAMVPQTHSVTVLVLVPKTLFAKPAECLPGISLLSRTDITDSVRGITLQERTHAEADALLNAVRTRYGLSTELDMRELLLMAQRRQQGAFFKKLGEKIRYPQSIWLDILSVAAGSRYAPAQIELPPPHDSDLSATQNATLLDNMKDAATITLSGGRDLLSSRLAATLTVTKEGKAYTLPAAKLEVTGNGRQLRITFPSPGALNLAKAGDAPSLMLQITNSRPLWSESADDTWVLQAGQLAYLANAAPEAGKSPAAVVEMSISVPAIVSEKGAGAIQVTFKINDASTKVLFSAEGGDITAIRSTPDGALVVADGGRWAVAKAGVASVSLSNLVVGNTVTLALVGDDSKTIGQVRVPVK
jgi:hypothetical protein